MKYVPITLAVALVAGLLGLAVSNMIWWGTPMPSGYDKVVSSVLDAHGPPVDGERIRRGADLACADLRKTPDLGMVWERLTLAGGSSDEAVTIIAGATMWICPEFGYLYEDR